MLIVCLIYTVYFSIGYCSVECGHCSVTILLLLFVVFIVLLTSKFVVEIQNLIYLSRFGYNLELCGSNIGFVYIFILTLAIGIKLLRLLWPSGR